jgi:hypothetical protein
MIGKLNLAFKPVLVNDEKICNPYKTSYWSNSLKKCITCPNGWDLGKYKNHSSCYSKTQHFHTKIKWDMANKVCDNHIYSNGNSI